MKLIPTTINPVTITLYRGIPFDNNYAEHPLLSKQFLYHGVRGGTPMSVEIGSDKEDFINMINSNDEYVYPRTTKTGTYNFAFGNGLVTSVVMELTDNEINSNYMKVVSGTDVYYYFITGITQKNEVTYLLNLELDVFMTYSEEFLTNIKDKPVMTERKHCRRMLRRRILNSTKKFINMACFNQETTFNDVKPNIVKETTPLEYKDFIYDESDNYNDVMKEIKWCYVIYGRTSDADQLLYSENDVQYPYELICFPLIDYKLHFTDNGTPYEFDMSPYLALLLLSGNAHTLKMTISPFPPFKNGENIRFYKVNDNYHMEIKSVAQVTITGTALTELKFNSGFNGSGTRFVLFTASGVQLQMFSITNGFGGKFEYKDYPSDSGYFETEIPSINSDRDFGEYKLKLAPITSLRMSSYYGDEREIPTQLLFRHELSELNNKIKPYSIVSTNAESNVVFNGYDLGNEDLKSKRGNSNSLIYNLPTGKDAEQIYSMTSANQYENSKLMSGVGDAVKVIGGGLALAFGGTMAKVGGALAIASGVLGEVKNITDYTAKMKDLANTPNTYEFSGTSFPFDLSYSLADSSYLTPYIITYGVDDKTYNMCAEFLYHYGYDYNAESYFSTDLYADTDNIFERTLFNYVKIRDDITSKLIGSNLPQVVAKKMNDVLNAGIKFWNFFTLDLTDTSVVDNVLSKYFQKSTYCNAEV